MPAKRSGSRKPGFSRRGKRRAITAEDLRRLSIVSSTEISPDGTRVAFVRREIGSKNDYRTDIWMVAADSESTGGRPKSEANRFTNTGRDGAPAWSPDGSKLAFLSGRDGTSPQVWTIPANGGEASVLTSFPEGRLAGLEWSPDGRYLAVGFRPHAEERRRSASEERAKSGTSTPPVVVESLWYRVDGDGVFGDTRFSLYLIDASTGEHREVFSKDSLGMFSFAFSPDSKTIAVTANSDTRAEIRPWKTTIWLVDIASRKARKIPGLPQGPKETIAWSPDGKSIAFAGREGRDRSYSTENLELLVCDVRTGRTESLTGHTDYCLLAVTVSDCLDTSFSPVVEWHPDGRRIFTRIGWEGEAHVASVDRRTKKLRFLTAGALDYAFGSISTNGKRLACVRSSATEPCDVHVGEITSNELRTRRVTAFNDELLAELTLAKPKTAWVKSTEGTRVETWSLSPTKTRAPGKTRRKRAPALLCIHGGPHAQYGVAFFHELQFLAAQGYHVYYPNPRGSKGYGRDFCAAIRGDWGNRDWEDILAVTEQIRRNPRVDPDRVGIIGGSYGGYMTNWAISHCDLFAAAVTDRCVSNLISMFGTSDFPEIPGNYWEGNSWDGVEKRWERSPLKHFGKVETPTLIVHSEGDLRCSIEQAEQVFTALQLRGVPSRFVRYPPDTNHGMSRGGPPDLRIHRLEEIAAWFGKYLDP